MGATVVDYMPILLALHGHQQHKKCGEERFYLHFRLVNRLAEIEDLDVPVPYPEGAARWLSWRFHPDARRAAREIMAAHRAAGMGVPDLDLLRIRLRFQSDTGYLRDQPESVERLW